MDCGEVVVVASEQGQEEATHERHAWPLDARAWLRQWEGAIVSVNLHPITHHHIPWEHLLQHGLRQRECSRQAPVSACRITLHSCLGPCEDIHGGKVLHCRMLCHRETLSTLTGKLS